MAVMKATITTMLLLVLHVASSWGITTMNAQDNLALKAMKAAFNKNEYFPVIKCSSDELDPIQCDKAGRVTYLTIVGFSVKGRIAPEIGNLTKLTYLGLSENQLSGSIPSSIGNLKFLTDLYLDNNQLRGSIPLSIGGLKSLVNLDLSYNQLSGNIPSSIGNLKFFEFISIDNNQLSGGIRSTIVKLQFIWWFRISKNYFTGPILQVNNEPACYELSSNCLFGASLPKGCKASDQRSKSACLSFCNATQVGGPCGGKGICSIGIDGKTITCACDQGYNNKANTYTCK